MHLKDIDKNFNDPDELDDFIDGSLHAHENQRHIMEDRKSQQTNVLSYFLHNQIIGTLSWSKKMITSMMLLSFGRTNFYPSSWGMQPTTLVQ